MAESLSDCSATVGLSHLYYTAPVGECIGDGVCDNKAAPAAVIFPCVWVGCMCVGGKTGSQGLVACELPWRCTGDIVVGKPLAGLQ